MLLFFQQVPEQVTGTKSESRYLQAHPGLTKNSIQTDSLLHEHNIRKVQRFRVTQSHAEPVRQACDAGTESECCLELSQCCSYTLVINETLIPVGRVYVEQPPQELLADLSPLLLFQPCLRPQPH